MLFATFLQYKRSLQADSVRNFLKHVPACGQSTKDLGPSALVPLTLDDPSVKVFKIHDLAPFTLAKSFQKSSVKV